MPLDCKTCAEFGKATAKCALPVQLPSATPTQQQIQQAMLQTGGWVCVSIHLIVTPPHHHHFHTNTH